MFDINTAWRQIFDMWKQGMLSHQEAVTAQELLYYAQQDNRPFTYPF